MVSELGFYYFHFSFFAIEGKVAKFFHHLSLSKITQVAAFDPASLIIRKMKCQAVKIFSVFNQGFYTVYFMFCRAVVEFRLVCF